MLYLKQRNKTMSTSKTVLKEILRDTGAIITIKTLDETESGEGGIFKVEVKNFQSMDNTTKKAESIGMWIPPSYKEKIKDAVGYVLDNYVYYNLPSQNIKLKTVKEDYYLEIEWKYLRYSSDKKLFSYFNFDDNDKRKIRGFHSIKDIIIGKYMKDGIFDIVNRRIVWDTIEYSPSQFETSFFKDGKMLTKERKVTNTMTPYTLAFKIFNNWSYNMHSLYIKVLKSIQEKVRFSTCYESFNTVLNLAEDKKYNDIKRFHIIKVEFDAKNPNVRRSKAYSAMLTTYTGRKTKAREIGIYVPNKKKESKYIRDHWKFYALIECANKKDKAIAMKAVKDNLHTVSPDIIRQIREYFNDTEIMDMIPDVSRQLRHVNNPMDFITIIKRIVMPLGFLQLRDRNTVLWDKSFIDGKEITYDISKGIGNVWKEVSEIKHNVDKLLYPFVFSITVYYSLINAESARFSRELELQCKSFSPYVRLLLENTIRYLKSYRHRIGGNTREARKFISALRI
uniref:Uncharacterized protein n=1 Tax=Pithovirus LCDPAC01 TaxID=2506600 RepID=A0A481YMV3_9VIRU|nr:MAG: hypothetical protein LCDPAC01_01200 [Pithovirus LCDPAC01]